MITSAEYKEFEFKDIPLSTKELFNFENYEDWVDTPTWKYRECGVPKEDRPELTITLDAKGRLCRRGADFMRARDEDTFPITVYILDFVV